MRGERHRSFIGVGYVRSIWMGFILPTGRIIDAMPSVALAGLRLEHAYSRCWRAASISNAEAMFDPLSLRRAWVVFY